MLFISHDLRVVRQVSQRVAVMYLGRIVETGSADDLFATPLHPYTRALVSASPAPGRRSAGRTVLQGDPPNPANRPSGCAFHPRCPSALPRCRVEQPAVSQPRRDAQRRLPPLCGRPGGKERRLMLRFFALRMGRALLTIVLVVTFAFVVLRLSGDPALMIMGPEAPPEVIAAFRKAWGLDEPIWMQYFDYFGAIAQGELGRSMRDGRPAIVLVAERIPATLALTLPALLIKVGIGIPAGIYAALHRGSAIDRAVMIAAVAGFTVPSFVLALLLVLIFAVQLGWLPSGGQDSWRHAILPIFTLGVGGAAVLARFTRSAMLEILGQHYIRTASAKGVPWRAVVTNHALPNAAIPTVTIVGFMVGSLIAGAVVVESVFSWPGVGRLLVVAVANRDLAVVQCILLLVALTMVTSNLIVDFLYGFLDPRLRTRTGSA